MKLKTQEQHDKKYSERVWFAWYPIYAYRGRDKKQMDKVWLVNVTAVPHYGDYLTGYSWKYFQ